MKKFLVVNLLVLFVSFSSFGQKKETKVVEITASEVEKTRGENPNIIEDFVCDAPDVEAPQPETTRGAVCRIKIDNYTGFDIKVYVDGYFKGWVHPWKDGTVSVASGYTTVYCVTAGGSYEWKAAGNCSSNYSYKLRKSNAY